ncbi:MAG: hypothetical protein LUG99_18015 [Lachnospiraceae bacterium]|nr:hypothetical protein [Lachnospiraceae bacterium]
MSKYEKETIINFNEAEQMANVYTFNAALRRKNRASELQTHKISKGTATSNLFGG